MNRNGPIVVEWGRELGSKQVDIECSDGDYDSDGRVSLLLQVRPVSATPVGSPVSWQIKNLGMSFEAETVARPWAVMLDEEKK
jgi:hypothetical protein